jgi:hypothetical protein
VGAEGLKMSLMTWISLLSIIAILEFIIILIIAISRDKKSKGTHDSLREMRIKLERSKKVRAELAEDCAFKGAKLELINDILHIGQEGSDNEIAAVRKMLRHLPDDSGD